MSIDPDFIRQLAAVGARAPSADNCQPWQLRWNGAELALQFAVRHAEYNVFGAASHATLLSVGAVMENLDAALVANGLPVAWRWGNEDGLPYAALPITATPQRFAAPAAPMLRHTNRSPYRRAALPATLAEELAAHGEGGNRVALVTDGAPLVKLVRICSEARFCSQELHTWLFGSLRATPSEVAQGDGLDLECLGLPPGGRQMLGFMSNWPRLARLNRLGAYKLLAWSEMGLLSAAPGLLCITGPGGWRGSIDAGRLLERVWGELNQQGLAVHPYYVVCDQINRLHAGTLAAGFEARIAAAEVQLRSQLALQPGHQLHMILRVGYPTVDPVRSRRLPLDAVFPAGGAL
jgi:hypothetical protein